MLQTLVSSMKEQVNHPDHYKSGKFEVIEIIEEFNLGFNLGNVIKYVLRAGKKNNTIEDLKKAIKYLEFEIAKLEREETNGKI